MLQVSETLDHSVMVLGSESEQAAAGVHELDPPVTGISCTLVQLQSSFQPARNTLHATSRSRLLAAGLFPQSLLEPSLEEGGVGSVAGSGVGGSGGAGAERGAEGSSQPP